MSDAHPPEGASAGGGVPPLRRARRRRRAAAGPLAIHVRVVKALILREVITRYGRHNIGFFWLFLEPMLFTLGITAVWNLFGAHHGSSLPIASFALTGYSTLLLWRNCAGRCINAIEPNASLLYHRNIRPIDIYVSRVLLEIAGATGSLVALTVVFVAVGFMPPPNDPLTALGAWALLALFAAGLGLLIGTLSQRTELVERVWHVFAYLLFPLSGAAFLVDALAPAAQQYALMNPLVHATEMLRDGYFGDVKRMHYSVGFLGSCTLVLWLLALSSERIVAPGTQPE